MVYQWHRMLHIKFLLMSCFYEQNKKASIRLNHVIQSRCADLPMYFRQAVGRLADCSQNLAYQELTCTSIDIWQKLPIPSHIAFKKGSLTLKNIFCYHLQFLNHFWAAIACHFKVIEASLGWSSSQMRCFYIT